MQVAAGATSSIWMTSCARISLFVGFADGLLCFLCCLLFLLPCCSIFWCCFCSVQCLIFLHCKSAGYTNLCLLVFGFFWRRCLFFCILITYTHPYRTARPLICHHYPPVSSLTPSTILVNNVVFCCPWSHLQNMPWSPIFASFRLASLLPRTNTPYCTHANPCAPIRSRLYPFCFCSAKHDVRGNFPGHRPKSGPVRP